MISFLSGLLFIVLITSPQETNGQGVGSAASTVETGENIIISGISSGQAIFTEIPDLIPTPLDILSLTKEAFAGLPFQVALAVIDRLCTIALSGGSAQGKYTPNPNEMGLILRRGNDSAEYALTKAEEILSDPLFILEDNLVIYVTGWRTDFSDGQENPESTDVMFKAYSARGGYNFVILDSARYIDTVYSWSAFNTEEIGRQLAIALTRIPDTFPVERIHLIGHSLGAQIVGAAGRYFLELTGKLIPRITGLDPANPCFREGEVLTGIYRGDAEFVDIIHTDNGALGKKEPVGDVDFYPNGMGAIQPGCISIECSHARAWRYYAESVYPNNERNFLATRCFSLKALEEDMCHGTPIPMGFAAPNVRGNYFLRTRASSPFGENNLNH